MKDMFGINVSGMIAPLRGFGSHLVFFIRLHPMLMITPLRGWN